MGLSVVECCMKAHGHRRSMLLVGAGRSRRVVGHTQGTPMGKPQSTGCATLPIRFSEKTWCASHGSAQTKESESRRRSILRNGIGRSRRDLAIRSPRSGACIPMENPRESPRVQGVPSSVCACLGVRGNFSLREYAKVRIRKSKAQHSEGWYW